MPKFTLPFNDVPTESGATKDLYTTIASLIVADTAGHRCRVLSINIGCDDDTPEDRVVSVKLARIADVSAGAAGTKTAVTGANMAKTDPNSVASIITGGRTYTAEPTAYETEPLFEQPFNLRSGFIKEWPENQAKIADRDMLIGVLVAPRTANIARVSGSIEFEVY